MFSYLKINIRKCLNQLKFIKSVNWFKSIYFNLKMLPFKQAKKLPILFYGKVKFTGLKGKIVFKDSIKFGMVGFGQNYELMSVSKGNAQLTLNGTFIIGGYIQFGKDFFVYVDQNAILEMGQMSSLGNSGKIICFNNIHFGNYARVGYESQIIDTNFHKMIDLKTNIIGDIIKPIKIGNYNYIGNRVSLMKGTTTPDYCTVTSNSVLTKDYLMLGENLMLGGIPAKLLRTDIKRAWGEENIEDFLIVSK